MLAHNKITGVKQAVETVIAAYNVPSKNIVTLKGFVAFGTCAAIYRLYAGTEVRGCYMTSEAQREANLKIDENIVGPVNIALKVIHYAFKNVKTDEFSHGIEFAYHDFEGTILGEG